MRWGGGGGGGNQYLFIIWVHHIVSASSLYVVLVSYRAYNFKIIHDVSFIQENSCKSILLFLFCQSNSLDKVNKKTATYKMENFALLFIMVVVSTFNVRPDLL